MRVLLLRSGSTDPDDALSADVTVLRTHTVVPHAGGVAEALAFDAQGATLVVSSRETAQHVFPLFKKPFAELLVVGEGTGEFLRRVMEGGAYGTASAHAHMPIRLPELPGAAGILQLLRGSPAGVPLRILWPHGSDAAAGPFEELRAMGTEVCAPVVYVKSPLKPSELNPSILADFRAGRFAAVAVGSTAGLDVLLTALGPAGTPPPNVRWGVLGPETAKAVTARGLPPPLTPAHARLSDLLELLLKEIR